MAALVSCFVMPVLHAMNHRTGGHKEQRLKESVRYQMENSGHICAHSGGGDHKPQLADGGISQHFLDVILGKSNDRSI